jgi:hypothetical protein
MDYVGDYTNDFGVTHQFARLPVYAVVSGSRADTTGGFDANYLPPSWLAVVVAVSRFSCEIPEQPRRARAWYAPDAYLSIPVLWPGGSGPFGVFWSELVAMPGVLMATLDGERVPCFWLDRYANYP